MCTSSIRKFSVLAFLFLNFWGFTANAQLGRFDSLYYGGVGIDYKCTGGLVLADSSVIVTGRFAFANERFINGIAKLKYDGSVDPLFNTGTGADEHVNVVVRQPDGKYIIGGDFIKFNGQTRNRIARLNANGSLDNTFNTGTGTNNSVYAIYLQPDGKILLGGAFFTFNNDTVGYLVRLNNDGSRDTSFHSGYGFDNLVYSIDRQSDGQYIVAGNFLSYKDSSAGRIARIDSNGVFDNTFNPGYGANGIITSAYLLPNGKIMAAGYFTLYDSISSPRIVRINSNGSLDISFVVGTGFNSNVNELYIQPDGKILATGNFTNYNGGAINRLIRIDSVGNRDLSFAPGTGLNLSCNTIFMDNDQKIYVGGTFTTVDSFARIRLARLLPSGKVDQSFFNNSKLNGQIFGIGFQSDGKAILGGQFTKYNQTNTNRIARFNLDGSLDNTFQSGIGANNIIRSVVILPDDKILIGGDFTNYNGTPINRIARLNANGTLDNTFTVGTGASASVYNITVTATGKILITGSFVTYNGDSVNRLTRLNSNGVRDNTFSSGTGLNNIGRDIAIQNDGKIIVVGLFTAYQGTSRNRIIRIDTTGAYDNTFSIGTACNNALYAVTLQQNGKIIIGGNFTNYNGTLKTRIARLNNDGTLDTTYKATATGIIYDILPIRNPAFFPGGVLVGGAITAMNGIGRNRIAFLNEAGVIDTLNYYTGTGADGIINVFAENIVDRKIFIGGDFSSMQTHVANRIAGIRNSYTYLTSISDTLCRGITTKVYFNKDETYYGNNQFTVQLSDSIGNFINAVNIGNQLSVDPGSDSITVTIPASTPTGNNYHVRIISSNPKDTSNISRALAVVSSGSSTITANSSTTFCSGGSVALVAESGTSYIWSNGDTTQSILAAVSGNYQVTVNNSGCVEASNVQSVTVNQSPDSSLTISSVAICNGGTAILTASVGLTYQWSNGELTSSINVTQSGTYSVTVSDNGCQSDSSIVIDFSNYFGNLITTSDSTTFCSGGSAILSSTPGLSYLWSTLDTTQSIVVTSTGNYDVTVSDGICFDTSSVIHITVNNLPSVDVLPLTETGSNALCANEFIQGVINTGLPAGGSYFGNAFISNDTLYAQDAFIAGYDSFNIYYTYTDVNGCSATDSALQILGVCGGIENIQQNGLALYPNPTQNTITLTGSYRAIREVRLMDILGREIMRQPGNGLSEINIQVNLLAAGTYVIYADNHRLKFVKN
ncbi:MAG: T9SS type A sorting domain-containing protein [Chitinophagales bacterium]